MLHKNYSVKHLLEVSIVFPFHRYEMEMKDVSRPPESLRTILQSNAFFFFFHTVMITSPLCDVSPLP